jgi:hypothetical protein
MDGTSTARVSRIRRRRRQGRPEQGDPAPAVSDGGGWNGVAGSLRGSVKRVICSLPFRLKKTKPVGVKTAPMVFIKKKKPSLGLENPRTPVSPVRGFF